MEYVECSPKRLKTCQNMYSESSSSSLVDPNNKECYPGCQCAAGTFFNGTACVTARRCPCFYRGQKFEQGNSVNIDCNLWWVSMICFNLK